MQDIEAAVREADPVSLPARLIDQSQDRIQGLDLGVVQGAALRGECHAQLRIRHGSGAAPSDGDAACEIGQRGRCRNRGAGRHRCCQGRKDGVPCAHDIIDLAANAGDAMLLAHSHQQHPVGTQGGQNPVDAGPRTQGQSGFDDGRLT